MNIVGFVCGLVITGVTAYLIIKKYKPQAVLILSGLLMLFLSIPLSSQPIMDEKATTGNIFLDAVDLIRETFSTTGADLGLVIMTVGGFALIMEKIGASEALVRYAIKPLRKINAPYLIVAIAYVIGQLLSLIIPSASSLALLLMVTMYPVLRSIGLSKLTSAAVIGTTCCIDLGPQSSNSNLSAKVSGMSVQQYFLHYQGPVAIAVALTVAILHMIVQRHFDKKDGTLPVQVNMGKAAAGLGGQGVAVAGGMPAAADAGAPAGAVVKEKTRAPGYYALLPLFPLILLIVFSDVVVKGIKINVATGMFISLLLVMLIEVIRKRSFSCMADVMSVFFEGMGRQLVNVVTLIVAGQIFASGLSHIGFIDFIITGAQSMNLGVEIMTIMLALIIVLAALLTGSGNAAFFSFAPLSQQVAGSMGQPAIMLALPMELSAGIGRSMSPIAGVIMAIAGMIGVNPTDVVKRTIPVMAGAWLVMMASSFLWLHIAL